MKNGMRKIIALLGVCGLLFSTIAAATPESDVLLQKFWAEGAGAANPEKGRTDWAREVMVKDEKLSCSTCHTTNLAQEGKHHTTGKTIGPMSMRTNPERYTSVKKMEKWFKRNCLDVLGRECSAQEKTDFLTFLLTQ